MNVGKKIVFFDLDGTILDENKKIPESTRKAIYNLQENDIYTAIATGRGPLDMEWVAEELNINSYVAINGAYAQYDGVKIYLEAIEQEKLLNLVDTAKKHDHTLAFITYEDAWVLHADHPFIKKCVGTLRMDYPRVEKDLHIDQAVNQVVIYSEEKDDHIYREAHPDLEFIRFHQVGMDVMPKHISKAAGIKKILETGGFAVEDTYAFGDALNDIDMLSFVACGVAMGNSLPAVKEVADYVTTSNEDHGIWNACKKLGLF